MYSNISNILFLIINIFITYYTLSILEDSCKKSILLLSILLKWVIMSNKIKSMLKQSVENRLSKVFTIKINYYSSTYCRNCGTTNYSQITYSF
jgi:hypothetical protein